MTSPLQHAHDLANQAPRARDPVVCTVAGPRVPFSAEIYTGAELRPASMRPGAYDALALPSIFNGRAHAPGTFSNRKVVEWISPPPAPAVAIEPPTAPTRRQGKLRELRPGRETKASYLPREGSIPSLLLEHLRTHGGHMTYLEVARRFGLPPSSTTAVFKKALTESVIVRHLVDGRAAFALPGYVPPPQAPRPSKELLALQAQLARRVEKVAELQRDVLDIQARIRRLDASTN